MPTTSTTRSRGGFRRIAKRWGAQAAIMAAGAVFAVGTLEKTRFLPKPKLTERPFAELLTSKVEGAARPWAILDAGVEHDRIAYWMTRLTSGGTKGGVEQTLGKKGKYEEMIKAKLVERKMPADLIYLAMIESQFNPNATSPVKAKGLWQFMAATAREFGLTVRGGTDERTDPAKATDAALTYLQALKDRFGSWYLAAAAYNSGGGTVSKALRNTIGKTTGTDEDFFRIMPRLPKETQDYVPKLIATARVGNDPARYGLKVDSIAGIVDLSAMPVAPAAATIDKLKTSTAKKAIAKKSSSKKAMAGKSLSKRAMAKRTVVKRPVAKKPAVRRPATSKKRP